MESASPLHYCSPSLFLLVFLLVCLQNPWKPSAPAAAAVTDPSEVESLKSIANKMGLKQWDFSIDPCAWMPSSTPPNIGVCSCTNSSCHITTLDVVNLNVMGEIPLEIVNLTQLQNLRMGQNLFSGSIPIQLGRLTELLVIDLGGNRLSGSIPIELGNLTKLITLGVGGNLLSGALPKQLGQLNALNSLYIDSTGLSGELPVEFGKLTNLNIIWMFGNTFSGQIPDIFQSMSQLQELRMYGNNFTGPIPASLVSLRSLKILSIGELSNAGLIPTSFKDLKSIIYLSLRQNGLSGLIPEDLGSLGTLQILDLSLNNLTGRIPTSFAALKSLTKLFLGNNNLQGDISMLDEISTLENLDVSNNQFSGPIPAWVKSKTSLEVNLLWNFFEYNDAENRLPYATFNCLDKSLPCDRTASGQSGFFAINCGGPQVTVASTQTTYSDDSENLGNSSVFRSAKIWGVSNTGYYDHIFYTILTTTSIIQGASNEDLYKTARGAASSLRYYGSGLINGLYNVELHFAEIAITANSNGKRIFDVLIQGLIVLKDFNIYSMANGSYRALVRSFTANVTDNVLEVHLLWSGKGTCCLPTPGTYGPLISAIRVSADFYVPPSVSPSRRKIVVIVVPILASVTCFLVCFFIWRRRHRKRPFNALRGGRSGSLTSEEFFTMEAKPCMFTYKELRLATHNFHDKNKLGEGGFGAVFRGRLLDGTLVAVKLLTSESKKGKDHFVNEVATISTVKHRNLVKLLGCCIEEGREILVFEFLENNSLSHTLLGKRMFMDWPTRFNICTGIARGLTYLHEESRTRIVHRDIKASNVLLDENLNPKIADFGLAKLYQDDKTHVSTCVAGTIGYLAPEYALQGKLTEKADVYSFGMLLLEIVSGRSNTSTSLPNAMIYLLEWTWQLYEENRLLDLADESLEGNFEKEAVERVIHVALLCMQPLAAARPKMSEALSMLKGSAQISVNLTRPGFITDLKPVEPKNLNSVGTACTSTHLAE